MLTPGDVVMFAAYLDRLYSPIDSLNGLAVSLQENLTSLRRAVKLRDSGQPEPTGAPLPRGQGPRGVSRRPLWIHAGERGSARHQSDAAAGENYGARRTFGRGQNDHGRPASQVVRTVVGRDPAGRPTASTAGCSAVRAADRRGRVRWRGVSRNAGGEHPLQAAGRDLRRGSRSSACRGLWAVRSSVFRRDWIRKSASAASAFRSASGSGCKSRACWSISRAFWCWTRLRPIWITRPSWTYARRLEEISPKPTMLVIAHRYTMMKNADYVYVLKEGEVAEARAARRTAEGPWLVCGTGAGVGRGPQLRMKLKLNFNC